MFSDIFYNYPIWLWGTGLVILVTSLLTLSLYFVHLLIDRHMRKSHNEIALGLLAAITPAYAVLIALVAYNTLLVFTTANDVAQKEASYVGNIARDSYGLASADKKQIQDNMIKYLQQVMTVEWAAQQHGDIEKAKVAGWKILEDTGQIIMKYQASSGSQALIQAEMLKEMNKLYSARRERILASEESLPPVMWWVIALGGVLIILFCNFLGAEHVGMQILMTMMATISITLIVILIIALDRPFRGQLSVQPNEFEIVKNNLTHLAEVKARAQ